MQDEIHLAEGEGIFINAKQVHTAYPKQIYGEYLCLNLSPYLLGLEGSALFQQYMAPILFQTSVGYQLLRRSDSHTHKALQLLAQCSHEAERADGAYDLSLLAHLLLLWNELLKHFPTSPKNWDSLHNSRMQEILTYLQTHSENHPTGHCRCHPPQSQRMFPFFPHRIGTIPVSISDRTAYQPQY